MKRETWKTIVQIAISILTALATTLGPELGGFCILCFETLDFDVNR